MKQLSESEIPASQDLLLDVFRDGYADRYVGDEAFLSGYIARAQTALLDTRTEFLNGAALIGKSARITAIASRSNREVYGSRFGTFVSLLEASHEANDDAWIGVGIEGNEAVRAAVETAGMSRAYDAEHLTRRLELTGRLSAFAVQSTESGLILRLSGSNHGPAYWQEVWDWQ